MKRVIFFIVLTFLISISSFGIDKVFAEYKVKEFTFKGHEARIVFPHASNKNNYWIWRARFWGHEPQVDKALLEQGFHLVYVDVSNLFGNDEAVDLWNEFYSYCISNYKLNKKVVLEGMSRGGLIVYNWASKNTDKVFCIYADAPVCDIKSWPGGMYRGKGSAKAWETCLKVYNLDTVSVRTFTNIPINNCVNIAQAGIPVMHVYGDSDQVVPYEENTALLVKKFEEAGGHIELIKKEGVGHHPHCLKNPKPIVDFILKSVAFTE
ncbi:alpha/beta hydrolase family protein [Saccharicrinis fermentans]|uniref:Alpha/beta hydrolase family protein n=1 Tax=Saccharicrinis fermentans DSM 9555 = JCM 21142 TaxID=869213 RepID=W7YD09_9BACT|nr:prolyl oligopeptidase family serine peptidase [Saccharicrinis fermentans]GAF05368.1 alpha/beta hydrolase family protein [Saccharicrinis fermentans DSM 9555 = JCM 21142]